MIDLGRYIHDIYRALKHCRGYRRRTRARRSFHVGSYTREGRHVSQRQVFFFQLRQLRRIRRSVDRESAIILVHAFVTTRIDYSNALLANAPRK